MKVYFKWLDEWQVLNNDSDNICGESPKRFVEEVLSDKNTSPMEIIKITKNTTEYYVRAKDVVWKIEHNCNRYINEEKW